MKTPLLSTLLFCCAMLSCVTAWANPSVNISTSQGDIIIELDQEKAPITVKNFLDYVKEGSYNDSIFHRVINNFMIQGGGFSIKRDKLPTHDPIHNESKNGLSNQRGTLAMARTGNPHSATRQFFINHKDNSYLDATASNWGYAVFGKVVEGMDVVDKIAATPTSRDAKLGMKDVPKTPVIMKSITIIEPIK